MDELHPQEAVRKVLHEHFLPSSGADDGARWVLNAIDDGWAKLKGEWVRLEELDADLDDDVDSPTYEQFVSNYRVVV